MSFALRHGGGHLHANFVVAVLSDLFGIQARSGCFCAGPYLHRIYSIDDLWSERMEAEVAKGHLGAKLAFTRISFNYFISATVFDYIVEAVHLIAREGWKLPPLYRFDSESGLWHHRSGAQDEPVSLLDVLAERRCRYGSAPESSLAGQLEKARLIIAQAHARPPDPPPDEPPISEEFERIRWFPLPTEGLTEPRAAAAHGRGVFDRIGGARGT